MWQLMLIALASSSGPGTLDDLAWLEGTWTRESKGVTFTEQWIRPHPGLLIGIATTTREGQEEINEHLQIGWLDGVMTYTAWPSGQAMTHFKLSSRSPKRAVFENPAHDFPDRISYWNTPGKLHARVEGRPGGQPRSMEWTFDSRTDIPPGRKLTRSVTVPAPARKVWEAWTTVEGARTFFAPEAKIGSRPGGAYEIWFAPDWPEGLRGSEGCRLIELVPDRRLAFTWNFPGSIPSLRNAHTLVTLEFTRVSPEATQVDLVQTGWRKGTDWNRGFTYFEAAWTQVLDRLKKRFASGAVDWRKI